jgi:hypothetical protein
VLAKPVTASAAVSAKPVADEMKAAPSPAKPAISSCCQPIFSSFFRSNRVAAAPAKPAPKAADEKKAAPAPAKPKVSCTSSLTHTTIHIYTHASAQWPKTAYISSSRPHTLVP